MAAFPTRGPVTKRSVVLVAVVVEIIVPVAKVVVVLVKVTVVIEKLLVRVELRVRVVSVSVRLLENVVVDVSVLVTRDMIASCTKVQAVSWPEDAAWRVSIGLWQI